MRTTVALDDELLATACKWTGIDSKSDLLNFVLKEFIRREAGRRLAEMGGTMPELALTPRGDRTGRLPVADCAAEPSEEIESTKVAEE